ncbi:baseplate hub [Vibrio phage K469]
MYIALRGGHYTTKLVKDQITALGITIINKGNEIMALPCIPRTQRRWHCDYLDKTLTIQAFHIGLQTILLQTADDNTPANERADAMRQVVKDCVMEDVDVDALPTFVIEMIFVQARKISIGEIVELYYHCTNKPEGSDKECGGKVNVKVNLEDVVIKEYDGHSRDVKLGGDWTMRLMYPCLTMTDEDLDVDKAEDLICNFFECVFNEEEVHYRKDYSRDDLRNWVASLGTDVQLGVMETFFKQMPHIWYETEVPCDSCGHVHKVKFKSINTLFA